MRIPSRAQTLCMPSSSDVAEALWAEKANPYPRYMFIPVRRNRQTFQDRSRLMWSTCYCPAGWFPQGVVLYLGQCLFLLLSVRLKFGSGSSFGKWKTVRNLHLCHCAYAVHMATCTALEWLMRCWLIPAGHTFCLLDFSVLSMVEALQQTLKWYEGLHILSHMLIHMPLPKTSYC